MFLADLIVNILMNDFTFNLRKTAFCNLQYIILCWAAATAIGGGGSEHVDPPKFCIPPWLLYIPLPFF